MENAVSITPPPYDSQNDRLLPPSGHESEQVKTPVIRVLNEEIIKATLISKTRVSEIFKEFSRKIKAQKTRLTIFLG